MSRSTLVLYSLLIVYLSSSSLVLTNAQLSTSQRINRPVNGSAYRFRFILDTFTKDAYTRSTWSDAFPKNTKARSLFTFEKTLLGLISNFTGMNVSRNGIGLSGPVLVLNLTVRYQARLQQQHLAARSRFLTLLRQGPSYWDGLRNYINSKQRVYTSSVILSQIDELQSCRGNSKFSGGAQCWTRIGLRYPNYLLTNAMLLQITLDTTLSPSQSSYSSKVCVALANDCAEIFSSTGTIMELPRPQPYYSSTPKNGKVDCYIGFYFRSSASVVGGTNAVNAIQNAKRFPRTTAAFREARASSATWSIASISVIPRYQNFTRYNITLTSVKGIDWVNVAANPVLRDNVVHALIRYLNNEYFQSPTFIDSTRAALWIRSNNKVVICSLLTEGAYPGRAIPNLGFNVMNISVIPMGSAIVFREVVERRVTIGGPSLHLPVNKTKLRFQFTMNAWSSSAWSSSNWYLVFPKSYPRSLGAGEKVLLGLIRNYTRLNYTRYSFEIAGTNLFLNMSLHRPLSPRKEGLLKRLLRSDPSYWDPFARVIQSQGLLIPGVRLAAVFSSRAVCSLSGGCWSRVGNGRPLLRDCFRPVLVTVMLAVFGGGRTVTKDMGRQFCDTLSSDYAEAISPADRQPYPIVMSSSINTALLTCHFTFLYPQASSSYGNIELDMRSVTPYPATQSFLRRNGLNFLLDASLSVGRRSQTFSLLVNVSLKCGVVGNIDGLITSNPINADGLKSLLTASITQKLDQTVYIPFSTIVFSKGKRSTTSMSFRMVGFDGDNGATVRKAFANMKPFLFKIPYYSSSPPGCSVLYVWQNCTDFACGITPTPKPVFPPPMTTSPPTTTAAPTTNPPTTTQSPSPTPTTTTSSPTPTASPTPEPPTPAPPTPPPIPKLEIGVQISFVDPWDLVQNWKFYTSDYTFAALWRSVQTILLGGLSPLGFTQITGLQIRYYSSDKNVLRICGNISLGSEAVQDPTTLINAIPSTLDSYPDIAARLQYLQPRLLYTVEIITNATILHKQSLLTFGTETTRPKTTFPTFTTRLSQVNVFSIDFSHNASIAGLNLTGYVDYMRLLKYVGDGLKNDLSIASGGGCVIKVLTLTFMTTSLCSATVEVQGNSYEMITTTFTDPIRRRITDIVANGTQAGFQAVLGGNTAVRVQFGMIGTLDGRPSITFYPTFNTAGVLQAKQVTTSFIQGVVEAFALDAMRLHYLQRVDLPRSDILCFRTDYIQDGGFFIPEITVYADDAATLEIRKAILTDQPVVYAIDNVEDYLGVSHGAMQKVFFSTALPGGTFVDFAPATGAPVPATSIWFDPPVTATDLQPSAPSTVISLFIDATLPSGIISDTGLYLSTLSGAQTNIKLDLLKYASFNSSDLRVLSIRSGSVYVDVEILKKGLYDTLSASLKTAKSWTLSRTNVGFGISATARVTSMATLTMVNSTFVVRFSVTSTSQGQSPWLGVANFTSYGYTVALQVAKDIAQNMGTTIADVTPTAMDARDWVLSYEFLVRAATSISLSRRVALIPTSVLYYPSFRYAMVGLNSIPGGDMATLPTMIVIIEKDVSLVSTEATYVSLVYVPPPPTTPSPTSPPEVPECDSLCLAAAITGAFCVVGIILAFIAFFMRAAGFKIGGSKTNSKQKHKSEPLTTQSPRNNEA